MLHLQIAVQSTYLKFKHHVLTPSLTPPSPNFRSATNPSHPMKKTNTHHKLKLPPKEKKKKKVKCNSIPFLSTNWFKECLKYNWMPSLKCWIFEDQQCYQYQRNASHTAPMAKTIGKTIMPLEVKVGELLFSFNGVDVGGGGRFSTCIASFMPP